MLQLKGSLDGIGLPAIAQLISELQHSGTLELVRGHSRGVLTFKDGRLVAAQTGDELGLAALSDCATLLRDAEFNFAEGAPTAQPTLDLGPDELKDLLAKFANGHASTIVEPLAPATLETQPTLVTPVPANHEAEPQVCPLLGFVDDPTQHYSRPTALHRCFATHAPGPVTPLEQRELCLSGQFATCPRYSGALGQTAEPAAAAAPPAKAAPPTPPPVAPVRRVAASQPETTAAGGLGRAKVLLPIALVAVLAISIVVSFVSRPFAPPDTFGDVPSLATSTAARSDPTVAPTSQLAVAGAQATGAPTSPATPAATASAVPSGLPRRLVNVQFTNGPASGWVENPPLATWSSGAYSMKAARSRRFVAVGIPTPGALGDVEVSATFHKTGGPPGGGYGLILRDQGPQPRDGANQQGNYYVLEAGDRGEFGIWRRDGDHWVDLVPWTDSASVHGDTASNDLIARAVGDQLTLVVNGHELATVHDSTFAAGGVGVFLGGDYNEAALDRVSVQTLD
jgi:hypothetical protein